MVKHPDPEVQALITALEDQRDAAMVLSAAAQAKVQTLEKERDDLTAAVKIAAEEQERLREMLKPKVVHQDMTLHDAIIQEDAA